ncbi:phosphotransferase [Nonomuraea basaltis]|uniref:phosphotransferase n=1 Tax=Nonomuraea basaltis TaxID=2495887 RepID=UPI001486EF91|nr:phosphotransferase [Nonomuraea basaltis]
MTAISSTIANVDLTALVRKCVGRPDVEVDVVRVEPIDHQSSTPSTGGLRRVAGTTTCGREWSFIVKSLHSARHWPRLGMLPEPVRAEFAAEFPWRVEADIYRSGLPMPEGMRLPRLYLIDDLGDDRLDLWLEDVRTASGEWDLTRYAAAARALGRLAALRRVDPPASGVALRTYVMGRVVQGALPALRESETWSHPLIADHADPLLRMDLDALARRIPALLDAAERLPKSMAHGDASPENLLVPADSPGEFVAIDWGWQDPVPVGFDLGQLLVGLAHQGAIEPGELPAIHRTIETAYAQGLADEGMPADQATTGYLTTLVLRSAFTAIPLERLDDPVTPSLHELFRKRIGLARFIADLGLTL